MRQSSYCNHLTTRPQSQRVHMKPKTPYRFIEPDFYDSSEIAI